MNESKAGVTRGLGWILFILGVLGISGIAIYEFIIDTSMATPIKILTGLVWIGLGVLLFSVLRQRLSERKTDRYKDVEI
jgi:membrane-bound ClpP family serine protease